MLVEPADGAPDLADDLLHARRRRQRVFDQSHIDAVRQRTFGEKAEPLFVEKLPIPAVNESDGRRLRICGQEQV